MPGDGENEAPAALTAPPLAPVPTAEVLSPPVPHTALPSPPLPIAAPAAAEPPKTMGQNEAPAALTASPLAPVPTAEVLSPPVPLTALPSPPLPIAAPPAAPEPPKTAPPPNPPVAPKLKNFRKGLVGKLIRVKIKGKFTTGRVDAAYSKVVDLRVDNRLQSVALDDTTVYTVIDEAPQDAAAPQPLAEQGGGAVDAQGAANDLSKRRSPRLVPHVVVKPSKAARKRKRLDDGADASGSNRMPRPTRSQSSDGQSSDGENQPPASGGGGGETKRGRNAKDVETPKASRHSRRRGRVATPSVPCLPDEDRWQPPRVPAEAGVGVRLDELSQVYGAVILTGAISDGLLDMMKTHAARPELPQTCRSGQKIRAYGMEVFDRSRVLRTQGDFTPEEEEIARRLTEELGGWGVTVQAPTFIASLAEGCIQSPHLDMPVDGGAAHAGIVALLPGTHVYFYLKYDDGVGGAYEQVFLEPGELLYFPGDQLHNGGAFRLFNGRWHFYTINPPPDLRQRFVSPTEHAIDRATFAHEGGGISGGGKKELCMSHAGRVEWRGKEGV